MVVTLIAGLVVGLATALATPILAISDYRNMAPFVIAIVALLWLSRKGSLSRQGRVTVAEEAPAREPTGGPIARRDRGDLIRAVVIAVLLALVLFGLAARMSAYWIERVDAGRDLLGRRARSRTC